MAFPENTVNDTGIKHIWDKVVAALSGKVDKVSGKGLSTNDYTTTEKNKLAGIESGAQVNTVTSVAGKTGAVTLDKADVGLGNVDNTSDANKPISTATQNALDDKADANDVKSTQTLTGNPITITDAAGINAEALKVQFIPKQDLHGYDFPWVGGAGKNKFPMTVDGIKASNTEGTWSGNSYSFNGVVYSILTDSVENVIGIKANGTATSTSVLYILYSGISFDGSVYLNGCPSGGSINAYSLWGDSSGQYQDNGSGVYIPNGTAIIGKIRIANGYQADNVVFQPMVRLYTETDPTFAPWENICPITGYTEVGVEDVGKNYYDISQAQIATINSSGAVIPSTRRITSDKIYLESGEIITATTNKQDAILKWLVKYDSNDEYLGDETHNRASVTWSNSNNVAYIRLVFAFSDDRTISDVSDIPQIQVERGNQATSFVPYASTSATIPFSQTLYGGVSDFVEGGTDVTVDIEDLSTLSWLVGGSSSQLKYASASGYTIVVMAEQYKATNKVPNELSVGECTYYNNRIYVYPVSTSDDILGTAALLLTTPTTLSTPKAPLKLLQGTNNLTTNGTTITLDYIPNNSIGDAVKASEEYTDRAVERVAPKATLIDTWMISEESDTISVDLSSYDCNFFLFEYLFQSKRGTTLIPRPQGGSFSVSVVTYNNGSALYIELDYNPTTKELAYTSNVTSQFGILAIYTI